MVRTPYMCKEFRPWLVSVLIKIRLYNVCCASSMTWNGALKPFFAQARLRTDLGKTPGEAGGPYNPTRILQISCPCRSCSTFGRFSLWYSSSPCFCPRPHVNSQVGPSLSGRHRPVLYRRPESHNLTPCWVGASGPKLLKALSPQNKDPT